MSVLETSQILAEISREIHDCTKCGLSYTRKNTVPGEGPANAEILFIGEGPGFFENEQGRPFVGQAGKYLEELLHKVGLKREEVFITNVVKCRPPGNRDPQEEELTACRDYLDRQIRALQPRLIITLGRHSMALYFTDAKISMIHGNAVWIKGQMIVAMYHPAAGLHQPNLKPAIEKDFLKLPEYIQKARATPSNTIYTEEKRSSVEDEPKPTQLNLF
jgi:uracil-DNA glycosylase family 4